ncbi:MAG TPA: DinB family protein [Holophagaceae bacterium]|nr:DinB family protein [Holophagaceae bacterium]
MADPASPFQAYVAGLLDALGSRDPFEVLAGTPEALRGIVAGLNAEQEQRPEGPGTWSLRQTLQHLADSELVGAFRFRMILAHDAPELPGYDQDAWAQRLRYQEVDTAVSLGDFAAFRAANLRLLRRAAPEDLKRVMRHSERGDESLEKMISLYAGHDLVHLAQARRIRKATGA